MFKQNCKIIENKKVAPGHWVMTLRSRAIAKAAKPGQFVQLLCGENESQDPLLPRPFSFLTAQNDTFSVLYHAVGKGTILLSQKTKGDSLNILGPLGNGFSIKSVVHHPPSTIHLLVGGGVGIPPLYHLAETLIRSRQALRGSIYVFLGARHKKFILYERQFRKLGVSLKVATDDGSKGERGFVTKILEDHLSSVPCPLSSLKIYSCGPTPMLKAVSSISEKYKVPCDVSIEVPMACGFGACLGCAVKIRCENADRRPETSDFRFAIACTEGPVFQASELIWE